MSELAFIGTFILGALFGSVAMAFSIAIMDNRRERKWRGP